MKKTFKLEGLCCANCAAKIEHAISRLNGIENVSLSFMTTKLSIEANADAFPFIMEDIKKIIKKIEPDVRIVEIGVYL
ncbi:MAG: cation transporter [Ruminococcaceae bacterium]|nr:cation transporter [Oscillospiraceae bacterium]